MAFSNMFGVKKKLLKVKSYSIDPSQDLGQGAFGIVFKGSDGKKNTIAAKRIDAGKHPRILTQDFDRFLQLDHPNVMKILDVEKKEKVVWMMMPLCEFGDLNHFYRKKDVPQETNVNIMKQITAGIHYLHSQDIVHRDIKPGNILVASESPLQIQLADFDVCKCLDPEAKTSLMTSNVGTLAFKAPEFFQRTSPGQIEYHRNVDIYAAGLTFLAILQAGKEQKMLIPHIETPMDASELQVLSIGQLISERIKYKVTELSIVKIEGPHISLKRLISRMTSVNPEERLSAENVQYVLNNLESADFELEIPKMSLRCKGALQVPGLLTADVNEKDQVLARVTIRKLFLIHVLNRFSGEFSSRIVTKCSHTSACLIAHPSDSAYALEGCNRCRVIRNYNVHTGTSRVAYIGCKPIKMCQGPNGSVLVLYDRLFFFMVLCKFTWDKERQELVPDKRVFIQSGLLQMCYCERFDMFVVTKVTGEIVAVKLGCDIPVGESFGVAIGHIWRSWVVHGNHICKTCIVETSVGHWEWEAFILCKVLGVVGGNIWKSLAVHGGHMWKSCEEGGGHIYNLAKVSGHHIRNSCGMAVGHIWKLVGKGGRYICRILALDRGHTLKSLKMHGQMYNSLRGYVGPTWNLFKVASQQIWKSLGVANSNMWHLIVAHAGHTWTSLREGSGYIWKSFGVGSGHVWKLSGAVDGHVIKPDALAPDAEGNIYVSDGANNRILKVSGLTGNVIRILLLEENKKEIRCLFWSHTKPNLIML